MVLDDGRHLGCGFSGLLFAKYPEGDPKAQQALALGGRGRVIKTNYRTVALESRSSFSSASLSDKRCPSTNRLG